LAVPLAKVISNIFKFFIQFAIFLIFLFYFYQNGAPVHPNVGMVALPLIVMQMAILGIGCGLIVSACPQVPDEPGGDRSVVDVATPWSILFPRFPKSIGFFLLSIP
jgi:hypothetical protein